MSVQYGRWNSKVSRLRLDYIEKVSVGLAPYGPDSNESLFQGWRKDPLSRVSHHEGIVSREAAAYFFFLRGRLHGTAAWTIVLSSKRSYATASSAR